MATQNFLNEDGLQIYDLLIKNTFNSSLNNYDKNIFQPLKTSYKTTDDILKKLIISNYHQLDLIKPQLPYKEEYYSLSDIVKLSIFLDNGGGVIEDFLPTTPYRSQLKPLKFKQKITLNPRGKTDNYPLTFSGDTSLITEEVEWQIFNIDRQYDHNNRSGSYAFYDQTGAKGGDAYYNFLNNNRGIGYISDNSWSGYADYSIFDYNFPSFYVGMTAPLSTNLLLYSRPQTVYYSSTFSTGCISESGSSSTANYSDAAINCISKAMGQPYYYSNQNIFYIGGLRCFTKNQLEKVISYGFYDGKTFSNVALAGCYFDRSETQTEYIVFELASKTNAYSDNLTYSTVRLKYYAPNPSRPTTSGGYQYVDVNDFRQQLNDLNINIMLMGYLGGKKMFSENFPSRDKIISDKNNLLQYAGIATDNDNNY